MVYIQYSVTLISSWASTATNVSWYRLLVCAWDFNMILKFILAQFYVLHLNTSLNLHTISMWKVFIKKKLHLYDLYWLFETLHVQSRDISIRQLVTSPFKLVLFQILCKDYCRKTIEASIAKKVLNESQLIYAINIYIVASWCLLFLHGSHLNTDTNQKIHFFGDVNVSVNGNCDIWKFTSTLNTCSLITKSVVILIFNYILLFSICCSSV